VAKLNGEIEELEAQYRESVQRTGGIAGERNSGEVDQEVLSVHARRAVDAENRRRDLESEVAALRSAGGSGGWVASPELADPHLVELHSNATSELALLRATHGPNHPDTLDAKRKISILEKQIAEQLDRSLTRARADEQRLKTVYQREREASSLLEVERTRQEELQSELAVLSNARAAAQQALSEKELTIGALDRSGVQVRVIRRPEADPEAVWPRLELVMVPCVLLGGLGGALLALLRDRWRSPARVSHAPRRPDGAPEDAAVVSRQEKPPPARIADLL
jgi:uncharacterized protein involved in exopolysaccharide biosynthesis